MHPWDRRVALLVVGLTLAAAALLALGRRLST